MLLHNSEDSFLFIFFMDTIGRQNYGTYWYKSRVVYIIQQ